MSHEQRERKCPRCKEIPLKKRKRLCYECRVHGRRARARERYHRLKRERIAKGSKKLKVKY